MRFSRDARIEQIRQAGLTIAIGRGIACVTHETVAAHLIAQSVSISVATVRRYYHTIDALRYAVASHVGAPNLVRQQAKSLGIVVNMR
jgi:hypothetical protein